MGGDIHNPFKILVILLTLPFLFIINTQKEVCIVSSREKGGSIPSLIFKRSHTEKFYNGMHLLTKLDEAIFPHRK